MKHYVSKTNFCKWNKILFINYLVEISGLLNRRKVKFLATSYELAIKISQTNNNGSLKVDY